MYIEDSVFNRVKDVVQKLAGAAVVTGINDLDDQIKQAKEHLIQLYKLKYGTPTRKPVTITPEYITMLMERYNLADNRDITIDNNIVKIRFDTHMSFRYKASDVPFYVTAKKYTYILAFDLVSHNSAVYLPTRDLSAPDMARFGIRLYIPLSHEWGHPHASGVEGTMLTGLCYGDNQFPTLLHDDMSLNEITVYLDRALAWIRGVTADDNYNRLIMYASECDDLSKVMFPNNTLETIRKDLISIEEHWDDLTGTDHIRLYARYFGVYAYNVICKSNKQKARNCVLHAIATDVSSDIAQFCSATTLTDSPWYLETLRNCRKELEAQFL